MGRGPEGQTVGPTGGVGSHQEKEMEKCQVCLAILQHLAFHFYIFGLTIE